MALPLLLLGRYCCCYGGCGVPLGLRRTPAPASSLYRALRPPEPPPWPVLRHKILMLSCTKYQSEVAVLHNSVTNYSIKAIFVRAKGIKGILECPSFRLPGCHFSSKANSKKLTSVLVSKVKYLNKKYERYLERTFPRFYQLYSTFLKGLQVFFSEAKEIRRIKTNMSHKNMQFHQLPYREMERLRQFRRDLIKAIPVGILSLPPFANYFVLLLMYLFPRQLLIRHFWTPKQQAEFLNTYHNMRREAYTEVIDGLTHLSHFLDDPQLRQQMLYLCRKVQEGFHPDVTELKAVKTLFVGHPFGIQQLTVQHVKVLSRVLFLTPRLPSFFLRNRLRSHLSELYHLDQAMVKLGVSELTDEEAQVACYTRGLNSIHLSPSACRLWLNQWLSLSLSLRDSETSLLAHAMVLLSTNFASSSKS